MPYRDKEYSRMAKTTEGSKTIDKLSVKYSARKRVKRGLIPDLIGLDKNSAFSILDSLNIQYDHKGFGIVKEQYPVAGTPLKKNIVIKLHFKAPVYD